MYDAAAAAATEVVYYASKSLTQMRCIASHRQQAPMGMRSYTAQWPCVVVVIVGNRQRTESDERRRRYSMVRLVFCLWLAVSGFALFQRQATSKVSIGIFVRFPLASSAGRSAHTVGLHAGRQASQKSGLPTRISSSPVRVSAFSQNVIKRNQA